MTRYNYNSTDLLKPVDLNEREEFLLKESQVFCMYPWVHLHAFPNGDAYPCCHAETAHPVGNCRSKTLEQIYHDQPMQKLRDDLLSERANPTCNRCYEQERMGLFSGRKSANKHHGHNIKKIHDNKFELTYWDIRFSNLCNLSCRTCGDIFSSSWHQDQHSLVEELFLSSYQDIADPSWPKIKSVQEFLTLPDGIKNECRQKFGINPPHSHITKPIKTSPLVYAGRWETDMWEQLEPHLDYVEQIYFAGGEPLLMEEHYNILEELVRRKRFDVRLIYNTNFTHTKLKNRSVFEYWSMFESVAVGASLDGEGARAEYIRNGTKWDTILRNRYEMLEKCPRTDFYISPTLSILNAMHLPDFHKSWVNKGLIKPQDFNMNVLQGPSWYRIDVAHNDYKHMIRERYQEHLEWLQPLDRLERASVGFKSALNFLDNHNSELLSEFWKKTRALDKIRNQNVLDSIPELKALL
jgi:radical SAM protein with 4Fe4S-binding SPASM domain